MKSVHAIPVSQPGEFLCEIATGKQAKSRFITNRLSEASRLERHGAVIFVSRAGGWVRKD